MMRTCSRVIALAVLTIGVIAAADRPRKLPPPPEEVVANWHENNRAEPATSTIYDAGITALRGETIAAGRLALPMDRVTKTDDYMKVDLGFYLSAEQVRGFALVMPADAMKLVKEKWTNQVPLKPLKVESEGVLQTIHFAAEAPKAD